MAESRKIIKVFLGSPGDLSDERQAAKSVVEDLNSIFADSHGYQVDLVGWENTISIYGRPQEVINRELERCDMFIGMMWRRWGTPPDNVGKFTSGFEEEFVTSESRLTTTGSPEISLFFKEIGSEFLRDPGDDLKKVQAFKESLVVKKTIYFSTFSDTREFEKKLMRCISSYINKLWIAEKDAVAAQNQAPAGDPPSSTEKEDHKSDNAHVALSTSGASFLKDFITFAEKENDVERLEPFEVARCRLLSTVVRQVGNDEGYLGVHDSNLLYVHANNIDFGQNEIRALLKAGLEHYSSENVPMWRWLTACGGFSKPILSTLTLSGVSDDAKIGALKAMRLIAEPISVPDITGRPLFLSAWLRPKTPTAMKIAALEYLADFGNFSDLQFSIEEFKRNDYRTTSAALTANIRINLRVSQESALRSVYELQPTSIDEKLLREVFSENSSASNSLLLEGADHANPVVRRFVVKALCMRGRLPTEKAEQFLLDEDPLTRFEALRFLRSSGRTYTKTQAKEYLVRTIANRGLGIISSHLPQTSGEDLLEIFELEGLRSLEKRKLDKLADRDVLFDSSPWFVRAERNFKSQSAELRAAIDDKFEQHFSAQLDKLSKKFAPTSDFIDKVKSLEKHLRNQMMSLGMDVLYRAKDLADIGRVRDALRNTDLEWVPDAVAYIQKLGRFEDIQLLIEASSRASGLRGQFLMGSPSKERIEVTAKAALALGKANLTEVLSLSMSSVLLCEVISIIPDQIFQQLPNGVVSKLFRSDAESVRKVACLKCITVFPKQRIKGLLHQMLLEDEVHFYNVVHWLDFGVSCPKPRVVAAAKRQLQLGFWMA